jgi:tRNA dimethylallyltransferase
VTEPPNPGLWPLVAVVGPTGAGKSELALLVAERLMGEILNCDSIQVYEGLDIGSAKLPAAARRGIPHHLLDLINVNQELTAGAYSRLARAVLLAVRFRRRLPVVTGGTGFYLRALLDGLSPAPQRNESLRTRLRTVAERRPAALHRFLRIHDPAAALRIHPNDRQKLIRALELAVLSRQPASRVQSAPRNRLESFAILKLGLAPHRSQLYERLNQRTAAMFHHGLLAETKALLDSGFPPQAKALQSLGYKQAQQVLAGELPIEEAIRDCQAKTRNYAKRQMTWFRREPGIEWFHGFGSDPAIQQQALALASAFVTQFAASN